MLCISPCWNNNTIQFGISNLPKQQELKNEQKQTSTTSVAPKYSFASSGHVSYYLLGVLTAIVTLTVLTLLVR